LETIHSDNLRNLGGSDFHCLQDIVYFHAIVTVAGKTPERREFLYPKALAATSPHERILSRFREANGAMMPHLSIPEVSLNSMMSQ